MPDDCVSRADIIRNRSRHIGPIGDLSIALQTRRHLVKAKILVAAAAAARRRPRACWHFKALPAGHAGRFESSPSFFPGATSGPLHPRSMHFDGGDWKLRRPWCSGQSPTLARAFVSRHFYVCRRLNSQFAISMQPVL